MSYKFQRSLEVATDQTLIEPNWEVILECVDMIRGGEVPVKEALKHIQKRYRNSNPHISHHALLILEACVKNCGKKFIREVATKEVMDDLKSMIISDPPEKIREKLLELIQCWTSAFKGIPEFKIVEDTHSLLKMNGFEFPPIDEAKAMFLADCAPDWAEGDNCYRCRVEFGMFTRKHHCRACGQIFCDKCSNKQMLLPQFGIEKKVRVCEACFDKRDNQTSSKTGQTKGKNISDDRSKPDEEAREKARKEAEEKEQEELQLALAISQSEAEAKEREKWNNLYSSQHTGVTNDPTPRETEANRQQTENDLPKSNVRDDYSISGPVDDSADQPFDSMLAKYLDRDYWERKRRETEEAQTRATAPPPSEISISVSSSVSQQPQMNGIGKGGNDVDENNKMSSSSLYTAPQNQLVGISSANKQIQQQQQLSVDDELSALYTKMDLSEIMMPQKTEHIPDAEEETAETSGFCRALKERVDTLNTRMRSNQLRGRSIVNDSAIHSLFSQLTDAHGKVLERMSTLEGQRERYERMQDNLSHITEARQAVNALRDENERQRREMLRAEHDRRQSQLRHKMEHMRQMKHEMLLNERQLAIQRFQNNERQIMQQRMLVQQPQQIHQYQMPPIVSPYPHQQHYQQIPNSIPPNTAVTMNAIPSLPQNITAPMPPNEMLTNVNLVGIRGFQSNEHQIMQQQMMGQQPQMHQYQMPHLASPYPHQQQLHYQQIPNSMPPNAITADEQKNGVQEDLLITFD
ncbi:hypothetical protein niasHT_033227 [Heterodera trifolii]|uniref:Hepatocyte growth factor-regulated tyrosine kinase substrate n=1 Tax=Heterodera trifolii TaxID=157864 RepID=A0ABD2J6R1_9BILA